MKTLRWKAFVISLMLNKFEIESQTLYVTIYFTILEQGEGYLRHADFYIPLIYKIENKEYCKFGNNILINNKIQPIVCTAGVRYISPIRLVPTYIQRAAIKSMCSKFHKDSFKTDRLVGGETDGQTKHGHTDTWTGLVRFVANFWSKLIFPVRV